MGLMDAILGEITGNMGSGQSSVSAESLVGGLIGAFSSGGGSQSGMLHGILGNLASSGLQELVSSWLSKGDNKPISAGQISSALDQNQLSELAGHLNVDAGSVPGVLAKLLPEIVDKISPNGQMPQAHELSGSLSSVMDVLKNL